MSDTFPDSGSLLQKALSPPKMKWRITFRNIQKNLICPFALEKKVTLVKRTPSGFEINTAKRNLECDNVVVATGTNPVPKIPENKRGAATHISGLYFVGMLFQYSLTPGLASGVGRDAAYIGKHFHKNLHAMPFS